MDQLTAADFADWIDRECAVASGDADLPMTLVAVEELDGSPREGGGFRLEFIGPARPILAQAIMKVGGPGGTHDIFMVPVASEPQGTRYEAVFY